MALRVDLYGPRGPFAIYIYACYYMAIGFNARTTGRRSYFI